jgi:hypothetical protein
MSKIHFVEMGTLSERHNGKGWSLCGGVFRPIMKDWSKVTCKSCLLKKPKEG